MFDTHSNTQVNRFQSPVVSQAYGNDEKVINATGQYQLSDDFQVIDDFSGQEEIVEESGLMDKVVQGFHVMLEKKKTEIENQSASSFNTQEPTT